MSKRCLIKYWGEQRLAFNGQCLTSYLAFLLYYAYPHIKCCDSCPCTFAQSIHQPYARLLLTLWSKKKHALICDACGPLPLEGVTLWVPGTFRHFPLLQLLLMLFCFGLNASQPRFPFIMFISVIALADPETKMPILLTLKPPAPWDSVCTGIHVIGSCISTNKTQN